VGSFPQRLSEADRADDAVVARGGCVMWRIPLLTLFRWWRAMYGTPRAQDN